MKCACGHGWLSRSYLLPRYVSFFLPPFFSVHTKRRLVKECVVRLSCGTTYLQDLARLLNTQFPCRRRSVRVVAWALVLNNAFVAALSLGLGFVRWLRYIQVGLGLGRRLAGKRLKLAVLLLTGKICALFFSALAWDCACFCSSCLWSSWLRFTLAAVSLALKKWGLVVPFE